jgi:hypothetical protein
MVIGYWASASPQAMVLPTKENGLNRRKGRKQSIKDIHE